MEKRLPSDQVHLWITKTKDASIPEVAESYRALITSEELSKVDRFLYEEDRIASLVARAMVRTVLAHYIGCRPEDICLSTSPTGKPRLADRPCPQFNLSHTRDLVVLAVSASIPVGVDTEMNRPIPDFLQIAERYFAREESETLTRLPPEDATARFYDLWMLKESYLKACGLGLHFPLKDCVFIPTFPTGHSFSTEISTRRPAELPKSRHALINMRAEGKIAITLLTDRNFSLKLFSGFPLGPWRQIEPSDL